MSFLKIYGGCCDHPLETVKYSRTTCNYDLKYYFLGYLFEQRKMKGFSLNSPRTVNSMNNSNDIFDVLILEYHGTVKPEDY